MGDRACGTEEKSKIYSKSCVEAEELAQSETKKYLVLRQFENPANPEIHVETTGPEIWNDIDGSKKRLLRSIYQFAG